MCALKKKTEVVYTLDDVGVKSIHGIVIPTNSNIAVIYSNIP